MLPHLPLIRSGGNSRPPTDISSIPFNCPLNQTSTIGFYNLRVYFVLFFQWFLDCTAWIACSTNLPLKF
jgi:hypothetical protein